MHSSETRHQSESSDPVLSSPQIPVYTQRELPGSCSDEEEDEDEDEDEDDLPRLVGGVADPLPGEASPASAPPPLHPWQHVAMLPADAGTADGTAGTPRTLVQPSRSGSVATAPIAAPVRLHAVSSILLII